MKKALSLFLTACFCLSMLLTLASCDDTGIGSPETSADESTAPETTAPETTAPETTAPETTAPETTVPETTVPETTASETTTAPNPDNPETTVPETTAPETAGNGNEGNLGENESTIKPPAGDTGNNGDASDTGSAGGNTDNNPPAGGNTDNNPPTPPAPPAGGNDSNAFNPATMTEQDWADMIEMLNSDNYTCRADQYMFIDQPEEDQAFFQMEMLFTAEKALYSQSAAPTITNQEYVGEEMEQLKQNNLQMIFYFMLDFEDFEFDAENGYFVNKDEIVTTFEALYGYPQEFRSNDCKITVDANGNLSTFECVYTQAVTYEPGVVDTFMQKIVYNFSDYGTTVLPVLD